MEETARTWSIEALARIAEMIVQIGYGQTDTLHRAQ